MPQRAALHACMQHVHVGVHISPTDQAHTARCCPFLITAQRNTSTHDDARASHRPPVQLPSWTRAACTCGRGAWSLAGSATKCVTPCLHDVFDDRPRDAGSAPGCVLHSQRDVKAGADLVQPEMCSMREACGSVRCACSHRCHHDRGQLRALVRNYSCPRCFTSGTC